MSDEKRISGFDYNEDPVSNAAYQISNQLNGVIIRTREMIGGSGREAIQLLIDYLQRKLKIGGIVSCGTIDLDSTGPSTYLDRDTKLVEELLHSYESTVIKQLGDSIRNKKLVKETLGLNFESTDVHSAGFSNITGLTDSLIKRLPGGGMSEEDQFYPIRYQNIFGHLNMNLYQSLVNKFKGQAIPIPLNLSKQKDMQLFTAIKYFTASIGIHERLFGTKKLSYSEMEVGSKYKELCKYVINDWEGGRTNDVPLHVLGQFNQMVNDYRTPTQIEAFKQTFSAMDKSKSCYQLQDNLLYFKGNINGRPDAVLFTKDNKPYGVVEFKGASSRPSGIPSPTALKQAALYHHMLGTKECFLCIYPTGNATFKLIIQNADKIADTKLITTTENIAHNYELFRKVANNKLQMSHN